MTASDPPDPVPPASLLVDPSVAGPDILFSTGTVSADGTENYSRVLPDIVGIADRYWNLTQWNAPGGIFDPAAPDAPGTIRDPLLGASLASWRTGGEPGATSSFAVFGTANDATFRLAAAGGTLRDTFLQSTGYAPGTLSFDRNLVFDARERLSAASAGGGNAYAFNGFTVFFNLPDNPHYDPSLFTTEIFLQAPLTDSRGEPGAFQTLAAGQDWQAIYDLSSENAAGNDDSVATLDYVADPGALHDVRLDLSAAMRRMTAAMARLDPAMATQLTDLSRWSLGSVYIGVESNGDGGADPAALALDVAHPTVFSTADAGTNGAVQTIDGGSYAVSTADARIATAAGTVNTLRLSGLPGGQDVASRGTDTVLVGNGQADTLHALGGSLCVQGDVSSWGRVSVDGDAPILVAGRFADLSVSGGGAGTTVSASVSGTANLFLSGFGARVDLSGAANASLSGASASFAAGAGTVSLFADGAAVDGNGPGTQTVFVDGHDATVTQTGSGRQVIVDSPTDSGRLDVSGGAGQQEIWTGNADVHVS
ncbi:MAG: hypothetical protein INR65_17675, partial [Gluconacetobacter diazotrophicus]|nr:hypothetical protein [Gluconacetobacter diazotrophicus]